MNDTQVIVLMAGWYATMMASAYWWNRHWFLRCLPITYGVGLGAVVAYLHSSDGVLPIVQELLVGLGGGVLFWFCVWIGTIEIHRKERR